MRIVKGNGNNTIKVKVKRAKAWPNGLRPGKHNRQRVNKFRRIGGRRKAKAKEVEDWTYHGPPPELRPFQREGVDFLAENNWRVLLADAPGCGKTGQVLVAMRENVRTLCPALAIVPASVVKNWAKEAHMWMPGVKVQLAANLVTPLVRGHHLTVTTWDLLAARKDEFCRYGFRLVVADEAHYAKNPDSQRSQALSEVAERAPHLLLLSGTPMVNDVDELMVLQSLFGEENPPMLRRLLEDVAPDIPSKRRIILEAAVPDEIRNEYKEVENIYAEWLQEYLPKIMDNELDIEAAAERATNSEGLSKLSYLRRVIGRGKVPGAAAWIRQKMQKKEPVVVFGQYVDVLDLLGQCLSKLGIPYVRLDGTTTLEQRQAAVEAFQKGKIDVFIGSQAAREGITLTRAAHLLFLERWWTPASEEQAEDRIRRIGQTRTTSIWYLHAEDTIDDRINEIVERKRALVARHIGTATIRTSGHAEIMDIWRQISELKNAVPLVCHNPKAEIDLPPLPKDRQRVWAVIFDAQAWPLDALQRYLRRNGYRCRKIERSGVVIRIQVRAKTMFEAGSFYRKTLADGFGVILGAALDHDAAARMRRVRAERKTLGVRRLTPRRMKPKLQRVGR
jgi:SNF2 family DNA or RNA helicase